MKSILLAATIVGSAIAGLIIYYQRKNDPARRLTNGDENSYHQLNNGYEHPERPMQHAMG